MPDFAFDVSNRKGPSGNVFGTCQCKILMFSAFNFIILNIFVKVKVET